MSRSRSPIDARETANFQEVLKSQDISSGGVRDIIDKSTGELIVNDQSVELTSNRVGGQILEPISPDLSLNKEEED